MESGRSLPISSSNLLSILFPISLVCRKGFYICAGQDPEFSNQFSYTSINDTIKYQRISGSCGKEGVQNRCED